MADSPSDRSDAPQPPRRRPGCGRARRGTRRDHAGRDAARGQRPGRRRSTSAGAGSSAASPASSSTPRQRSAGAAQALQQVSAEAAGAILNPAGVGCRTAAAAHDPGAARSATAGPSGFRTPFREDGGILYLIDQRRLPDALVEYPCKSAGEVAFAIREMVVRGAPAIGQVAAIGMALSAEHQRDGMPYARRATIRGSANALINARPTAVNLRWAVERVMARYERGRRPVG